jgi:putative membrane protein
VSDSETGAPQPGPAQPTPEPAALTTGLADGQWHRLHPATPLLRGGIALIAILLFIVNTLRERLIEMFFGGGQYEDDPLDWIMREGYVGFALAAIALGLLLFTGGFYLSWRMHTFRITNEVVEVRSGILFRTNRRGRLDRIQGINIVRPFIARLFGAAKLEVNVAGQDANVQLAYLGSAHADALRRDILRLASGTKLAEDKAAAAASGTILDQRVAEFLGPELDPDLAPPESVVKMNTGRLIGSILLSDTTIVLIAIIVASTITASALGAPVALIGLVPIVIGLGSVTISRFTKSLRYSIAGTPDGVRVGFGLLTISNETLPPGRIHSIQVSQPLLWRPFGWWDMKVNRASKSSTQGASGQQNTTILPVGSLDDVMRVLALMLPGVIREGAVDGTTAAADTDNTAIEAAVLEAAALDSSVARDSAPAEALAAPQSHNGQVDVAGLAPADAQLAGTAVDALALLRNGLISPGGDDGFVNSPRRAAPMRWFSWRRNGYAFGPSLVLLRKGAIWRELIVVPEPRVQSIAISQGPLQRRLGLASLLVHTVAGPITARLGAVAQNDALEFFEKSSRTIVTAASSDTSHRWRSREENI